MKAHGPRAGVRCAALSLVFSLSLIGCSSGSDSDDDHHPDPDPGSEDVSEGVFLDSPVAGIRYETPSQNGTTDGAGVFKYREGETVTLLDEREVELASGTVVVTDDSGPIGLAGIMGGLPTAVSKETTNVFLEAAFWPQDVIAGQPGGPCDPARRDVALVALDERHPHGKERNERTETTEAMDEVELATSLGNGPTLLTPALSAVEPAPAFGGDAASITSVSYPRRASASASVRPTGPPPTTTSGCRRGTPSRCSCDWT